MSKIYVAGPMRGYTEFNFRAFFAAQTLLEGFGWEVLNPAQNDVDNGIEWEGTDGSEELEGFNLGEALRWDLNAVIDADAIYLLNGWHRSTGAKIEHALAQALGKQVLYQYSTDPPIPPDRAGSACAIRKPIKNDVSDVYPELAAKSASVRLGAKLSTGLPKVPDSFLTALDIDAGKIRASSPDVGKIDAVRVLTGEVRTTSSTGGEKGMKPQRFDLIPIGALTALAEHYGVGALKYDDNQWRKGYEWSKSYAAMQRHLTAWWGGEDIDEETGSSHIAAAAWHCFTLLTFIKEHPDHDDRFKVRS